MILPCSTEGAAQAGAAGAVHLGCSQLPVPGLGQTVMELLWRAGVFISSSSLLWDRGGGLCAVLPWSSGLDGCSTVPHCGAGGEGENWSQEALVAFFPAVQSLPVGFFRLWALRVNPLLLRV